MYEDTPPIGVMNVEKQNFEREKQVMKQQSGAGI